MTLDSDGLEILDRDDCLMLLGRAPIGRVIFTEQALPAVQPVPFAFTGSAVVIRAAADSRLAAAARGMVVGFEADEFHPDTAAGWSVMIVGHATPVTDRHQREAFARLQLRQWSRGNGDGYIRIEAERASGRRTAGVISGPDELYR